MKNKFLNLNTISTKKYYFLVLIVFIAGISIRTYNISNYPAGLNQDEASIGYEAFSILKSGNDRNGNSFPIHLVSWGNGQNALYAYLSMPFIKFFGLNVFSVRIVNSLFGILSLLIFYLVFRLISNKQSSLIALFIFTICPWSIMTARWGLESNIFPAIFFTGIFFLLLSIKRSQIYLIPTAVFFAISLYSYGTSYLFIPIFLIILIPTIARYYTLKFKYVFLSILSFLFISIPIILFVLINHFNLQQIEIAGITIPKLVENRTDVIFNLFNGNFFITIIKNTLRFLSIIILQSDNFEYNAIPLFGIVYLISFPFFIIGIIKVIKSKIQVQEFHQIVFLIWLISGTIIGITCHVNINRINIIFIPIIYFTILGIIEFKTFLKPEHLKFYYPMLFSIYLIYFSFFCEYYFSTFNDHMKKQFSYGLGQTIRYTENNFSNDTINIFSSTINMPYIYVSFYNQFPPEIYTKSLEFENGNNNGFRIVKKLGRYKFSNLNNSKNAINIIDNQNLNYLNKYTLLYQFGNYSVIKFK